MTPPPDRSLPPGSNGHDRNLVPKETYRSTWYGPNAEMDPAGIPLVHYLWILKRHRWKIVAFVLTSAICTFVVSKRLTPIYESTATVDIDRRMPTGVIGQDSNISAANDSDQFLATQVRIIQSDSVVRPVAQQFHLRELEGSGPDAPAVQGARAGETPVALKNLKVTRPPNTYLLLLSYRSPDPNLAADVANAVAHSYLERTYEIRYRATAGLSTFMEKQMEELKAKMERSGEALAQFEREFSLVNPEEKTSILSARLLQLNTEYTNAETERVKKEAAWSAVQGGSLEALQVSGQGDALQRISERLNDAKQKFADVKTHYGINHPEYRRASAEVAELENQFLSTKNNIVSRVQTDYREALNREDLLQKAVAETKAEFDHLNSRSFEYQTLKREADADKSLYEELVRKIKEAGINAGFQNSSIRIADQARPSSAPVFPKVRLNLILAVLFSGIIAIGAAILSDVIDNTIRDPEQAKTLLDVEVMGSLPMVKPWRGKLVPAPAEVVDGTKAIVKANRDMRASAGFDEAIRTLRNSIILSNFGRPLKSLMVTSASPAEGKTTVAVRLAIAHAQQNHKTLLIDGDLRRPGVHSRLGLKPESGLAAALMNGMQWREKVIPFESTSGLDILPAGPSAHRCADLMGANLGQILEEAESQYDLIIVDAPPVLGFPEPLQMAAAVDGIIIVSTAAQTNRKAVEMALATLRRLRANVLGLVLNQVTSDTSSGYYYQGYQGKYYKYYGSAKE